MKRETIFKALMYVALVVGLALTGCEAVENTLKDTSGSDTDADTDADGDTDTDSDLDTDTDSDSDTDTGFGGDTIPGSCEEAATALTSVGCEFYVGDMDNFNDPLEEQEDADPLEYSLVVSNPQAQQDAHIEVEDGSGGSLVSLTLTPGQLEVIDVACEGECLTLPAEIDVQGTLEQGGFRLTSDVPITAYQWNPYGHDIWTADASLLIPRSSLSGTYIVASWMSSLDSDQNMSQVMIIGTEDDTSLTIVPSADVAAYGGVGPFSAGVASPPINLDAADVLQIRTNAWTSDLTGTAIQADKPVAVFGGNSCANVPEYSCCCDHVEEQLLPLEAWGTSTVLARYAARSSCSESEDTALWRLIAGADGMTVHFDPPAPDYGTEHHFEQQGDYIEFHSPTDHFVEGLLDDPPDPDEPEAPLLAYQMMTGAYYASCGSDGYEGDPMMLLSPPAGQYLDRYVFTTDDVFDFDYDHIIVVRAAGAVVVLDCLGSLPDAEFTAVGSSGWEVGRFYIDDPGNSNDCVDGAHLISSEQQFGLSVVGTATFQSYGYLGGVGVRFINPDPVIE